MENIKNKPKLALTIDFEEEYHCENLTNEMPRLPSLKEVLPDLISKLKGTRGTIFVVSEIAKTYKQEILGLLDLGWELGSHTSTHRLLSTLNDMECSKEIRDSKLLLEDTFGERVNLFRAPCFSTNQKIHDLVMNSGYQIDASFVSGNFFHSRAAKESSIVSEKANKYVSRAAVLPPGGGYFRLLPYKAYKSNIMRTSDKVKSTYLHPWEFKKELLGTKYAKSLMSRFKHSVNHKHTFNKLDLIIRDFNLVTVNEAIRENV